MRLDQLEAALAALQEQGLLREPDDDLVRLGLEQRWGDALLDLSSNDYLCLRQGAPLVAAVEADGWGREAVTWPAAGRREGAALGASALGASPFGASSLGDATLGPSSLGDATLGASSLGPAGDVSRETFREVLPDIAFWAPPVGRGAGHPSGPGSASGTFPAEVGGPSEASVLLGEGSPSIPAVGVSSSVLLGEGSSSARPSERSQLSVRSGGGGSPPLPVGAAPPVLDGVRVAPGVGGEPSLADVGVAPGVGGEPSLADVGAAPPVLDGVRVSPGVGGEPSLADVGVTPGVGGEPSLEEVGAAPPVLDGVRVSRGAGAESSLEDVRVAPGLGVTPGEPDLLRGEPASTDLRRLEPTEPPGPSGMAGPTRIQTGFPVSRETPAAGAGSSRLIFGTDPLHLEIERRVAQWVGAPAALLFSTGYAANLGALACLLSPDDVVISDALNHASIIDGIRLSRAKPRVTPHLDLEAMERELEQAALDAPETAARWVIVESYYSMDGDGPDLGALRRLCDRHRAHLYVDEAHAFGLYGPQGAGRLAQEGVAADVVVAAFGKAVGSQGACVCGSVAVRTWLWNRARSFVFSTAPAPTLAASVLTQLAAAASAEQARAHVLALGDYLRAQASAAGLPLSSGSFGPICSVLAGTPRAAMTVAEALRDVGILAQPIRPPTVPDGQSRLRLTLHAGLTRGDVDRAIGALKLALARVEGAAHPA